MIKLNQFVLSACLMAIASFSTSAAFARGGDMVNNGGGIAEKNVFYAYEKLDKYILICLNSDACKLNERQKIVLRQILATLPREKSMQQLFFSSEKKMPGTYIIDGLVRVAKTGSEVGSPIYINSDLLYSRNEANSYDPVTIPEAVAILIHEMGHHQGSYSHEELDLIGVRASMLLQQKFISTPLIPWTSEISANVLNPNVVSSFPEVLLNIGDDVLDISRMYEETAMCYAITIPIPILPLPDLELLNKKPAGSLFHNVHWDKFSEKGDTLTVRIIGNVSNNCVYKTDIGIRNNDYKMAIGFTANKINGKWVLDRTSVEMNQYREPWYKLIKLPINPLHTLM
ncbi:hypothetical protein [Bdellovibrio svalbardensis]|uniref:Uncharacterized protein n=1 Tax=Bdellovibrio svalbardensis TaxID=2972972 RepID=A0ABT6DEB3_9BACT|nr:hypothetical protein [Bdellovibrio svalbardensis]MDG0815174.1 hypothetical protein [Bdellovibrio svalbardensis]